MKTGRTLVFNHIPKTGGMTLRVILNRVYGGQNIFLIKSTDIGGSLELFSRLTKEERQRFRVVSGHGAGLFLPYTEKPFRLAILREPISLFVSQYYYLKNTKDGGFYEEVSKMKSIDEYLEFAIEKGQDNLLTRYLSNSVHFLADPASPVPDMKKEGDALLEKASGALRDYDALIDLAAFDAGIFALADLLAWRRIPLYRPQNQGPKKRELSENALNKLRDALRYDIALYEDFVRSRLSIDQRFGKQTLRSFVFIARQKAISALFAR
jgi:hypothetical protein